MVVLCMMLLVTAISAQMAHRAAGRAVSVRSLARMERAFYIAEGAAERAASHIAGGGRVPTVLTGPLGAGTYHTVILVESGGGGMAGSLSGAIRINPNNSPDYSFLAVLPGGTRITRADLHPQRADYTGPADMVLVRPTGSGSQSSLTVNGAVYPIQNTNTHSFSGDLDIRIYNDSRDAQGRATGQWWVELDSDDATVGTDAHSQPIFRDTYFTIHSEGRVENSTRQVMIRGLQTVSWAKYAFWYHQEAMTLWMVGGETFEGPVHANQQFRFHSWRVDTHGQTRFFDTASSTASSIHRERTSVNPVFDRGLTLNAPVASMASVDFTALRNDASLILDGTTSIRISGNVLFVTNARRGWDRHPIARPDAGLIYVRTATTGDTASRPGDLTVNSTNGLSGRLTLVAERDILIDNHIRYQTNPIHNPETTDALGLIAQRHAVVTTNAPNNLDIFAHIITRDGGFGVADWNNTQRGPRGSLFVYGGIANRIRNAVGTTAGSGYIKNYVYDARFRRNPPPRYPVLPDEFQWLGWDG